MKINLKYTCPKCGRQSMELVDDNNLQCRGFFCGYKMSSVEYQLSPDINMLLGETKTNGAITFLLNSKKKEFAIIVDRVDNLTDENCYFGPYEISKLLDIQLIVDNSVVYENKSNALPMIAGGVMFGAIGSVAGSMISNNKTQIKNKRLFNLLIRIDDIRIPAFYVETYDSDLVYKFINTIELIRPKEANAG